MRSYCFEDGSIAVYEEAEEFVSVRSPGEAVICRVSPLHTERINTLIKQGFRFHDRVLLFEINAGATKPERESKRAGLTPIQAELGGDYGEAVYGLACAALTTDRRFHLRRDFDQENANKVIRGYIDWCRGENTELIKATWGGKLRGFTILLCREDGAFENLLGVTAPDITGLTTAIPLYYRTLDRISERSEGLARYIGRVSTANRASINLHIQLGGKVKDIYDEYIYIA